MPTIPDWRRSGKIGRGEHRLAYGQACLKLVLFTWRVHLYPFRTQKLSSTVPTIPDWRRSGKIGRGQHSSLAQSAEHAAVNRSVVGSSPTGGAKKSRLPFGSLLFLSFVSLGSNQLPLCATTFGCSLAIALPLPVAEEGSESVRQAPVFYEGASPDGKYVGANETCHLRSPGNEIPGTARVDWTYV